MDGSHGRGVLKNRYNNGCACLLFGINRCLLDLVIDLILDL